MTEKYVASVLNYFITVAECMFRDYYRGTKVSEYLFNSYYKVRKEPTLGCFKHIVARLARFDNWDELESYIESEETK